MLEEFIALYDKPVEAILSYSKRWGILGICEEHGLPLGHGCPPRYGSTYPSGAEDGDPISSWREYSKAANAILEIYASLSAGHTPDIKLWEHAIRPGKPHPDTDHYVQENLKDLDGTYHPLAAFENTPWIKWQKNSFFWAYARVAGNARVTREEVAFVVNEWLRIGGVRPHWSPRDLSRCFVSDGLFGGIAVQLWLVISGSEGWVTCSNPDCQKVYAPGRRPKTGQRHFCFQCRVANVPKRISNREYARRNRERVVSTSALPGLNELPGSE